MEVSATYPGEILFADEALNVPLGELFHKVLREGRVLHVPVQGNDTGVVFCDLGQTGAVGLSRGQSVSEFIVWRRRQFDSRDIHLWSGVCWGLDGGILHIGVAQQGPEIKDGMF